MEIKKIQQVDVPTLKNIICRILEPLYGSQEKAFNEWITGSGYKYAFMLVDSGKNVGFLSLKADPRKTYLKISTLIVFNGCQKMGYGKELLSWAVYFAKLFKYSKVKVTASEKKEGTLTFFKKFGFEVVEEKKGKYIPGVTEMILYKEII